MSGLLGHRYGPLLLVFFFNDTATPEIYTLSLHDALPICTPGTSGDRHCPDPESGTRRCPLRSRCRRSEEHTSELQSRRDLVCRLLLEKKKKACSSIPLCMASSCPQTRISAIPLLVSSRCA